MLRSCSPNRDAKHVSGQCDVRSVIRSTMSCHPARLHTSEIRPIASKLNSPRATCYSHQGGREVHVRSRESPAGHNLNIASDPNALASENSMLLEDNERLRGRIRHLESMLRETMTKCRGMAEGDASADTIDGTVMQRIPPEDPTFVRIDMLKMLGPHSYHYGISYDPMVCFPPLNVSCGLYSFRAGAKSRSKKGHGVSFYGWGDAFKESEEYQCTKMNLFYYPYRSLFHQQVWPS